MTQFKLSEYFEFFYNYIYSIFCIKMETYVWEHPFCFIHKRTVVLWITLHLRVIIISQDRTKINAKIFAPNTTHIIFWIFWKFKIYDLLYTILFWYTFYIIVYNIIICIHFIFLHTIFIFVYNKPYKNFLNISIYFHFLTSKK